MGKIIFTSVILWGLVSCTKDKEKNYVDFANATGSIEIHRCFCSESAFRYLIVFYGDNDTIRYNPVNLPDDFKDNNYSIVFSANLLNDSSIVYTNTATDAVIENFRVRNINLIDIKKLNE